MLLEVLMEPGAELFGVHEFRVRGRRRSLRGRPRLRRRRQFGALRLGASRDGGQQ
jgi:hypothetical protein